MSGPASIAELIAFHARVRPDAPAIAALDRPALSFAGLQRLAAETAGALAGCGITPAHRVALMTPNGAEAATAFLATAACTACAPLNPGYGAAELEFYLADLAPSALIVDARLDTPARDVARARAIPVLDLQPRAEAGSFALTGAAPVAAPGNSGAADVALLLHTSGTTSRPKLVPLLQSNLCASAANVAHALALQPADCCLNIMPLFHVHGLIACVLASVAAGARVVCAPGLEPERFAGQLRAGGASWYSGVPTMHQAVVGASGAAAPQGVALRFVRSSSAALAPRLLHELEALFGCPVIEAYGMTEAAHQIASNPLAPGARRPGSVGVAAGPEVSILGADGKACAPGEEGEIVIRGANVTPGYLNNPDANRAAFDHGWFRTGDLGRLDRDGYLFITGRLKELINRGGEKIAPREIDEALLDHPAVAQAVAFAVPHATLGEDVAAAVVLRPGATTDEQALRSFVFERLAAHKVPSRIVLVDAIPRGATGKLQRIGLAARLADALAPTPAAPRSRLELVLAELYAQVLGSEVGVLDNFFALGGDSLLATQLIARVQAVLGVELPAVAAFRQPSVAELAREITARSAGTPEEATLAELEAMTHAEVRELAALATELAASTGLRPVEPRGGAAQPPEG